VTHTEDPASYGDRWAAVYDEEHASLDPTPAVNLLAELADGGPVLELGIGTGRVAIPLLRRGVEVHGIEASQAMVAQLRKKLHGEELPVTLGDMADVRVDGSYEVVFAVFNTFFSLLEQDRQMTCFANVARVLAPSGVFVLECAVPDTSRFENGGQDVRVWGVEPDVVHVEAAVHDRDNQRVRAQHLAVRREAIQILPVAYRYVWPSELDLMAAMGGFRLRHRWSGWTGQPFTGSSRAHVSVYERAR
jgi:SAM-dependent methyltransferase